MQKSFPIVLIIAALGAAALHFMPTEVNASIAFIIGTIITGAALLLNAPQNSTSVSASQYSGPMMTLYVGNLPYRVHEGEVKELFGQYGPVSSVRLVRDRKTGRRKGFGFIEMSEAGAKKAMEKLNEFNFQERTLKVREAKSQDSDKTTNNAPQGNR